MMAHIREHIANFVYPEGAIERRRLSREAETDEITLMGNRRAFDRARLTAEDDSDIAIVIFDLNNLGLVNKKIGHTEGDARIQWAGEVITMVTNALGAPDRCFRIGGDEFAVLIDRFKADALIKNVEEMHGAIQYGDLIVSIAGSQGNTFMEADAKLQGHKRYIKAMYDKAA